MCTSDFFVRHTLRHLEPQCDACTRSNMSRKSRVRCICPHNNPSMQCRVLQHLRNNTQLSHIESRFHVQADRRHRLVHVGSGSTAMRSVSATSSVPGHDHNWLLFLLSRAAFSTPSVLLCCSASARPQRRTTSPSPAWARLLCGHENLFSADCTRPIATKPAGFGQAVHRGTDSFPTVSARERQIGPTRQSHRWKTMVCSGIERKNFAPARENLQRIHESSEVCLTLPRRWRRLWMVVSDTESSGKAFKHRPRLHRRTVVEADCELRDLQTHDRSTACVDEWNLSFKFPAVPQQKFCWRSDCRRIRQERRPTSMLLLGRASAIKQSGTRSKKLGDTARSWCSSQVVHRHRLWKWLDQSTRNGSNSLSDIHFLSLLASDTFPWNVLHKSLDTIKWSCMKDHQKSHRTRQQSKEISVHRVTDCLTKINNKKWLDPIKELFEYHFAISKQRWANKRSTYFSIKKQVRRWTNAQWSCTVELYSTQGNTDITELAVIDETVRKV